MEAKKSICDRLFRSASDRMGIHLVTLHQDPTPHHFSSTRRTYTSEEVHYMHLYVFFSLRPRRGYIHFFFFFFINVLACASAQCVVSGFGRRRRRRPFFFFSFLEFLLSSISRDDIVRVDFIFTAVAVIWVLVVLIFVGGSGT